MIKVSVIGAGTMGSGIAQIAATKGHEVCLYDTFNGAIENAQEKLHKILERLIDKEKISKEEKNNILSRINFTKDINNIKGSGLVIEAIIEDIVIKQKTFKKYNWPIIDVTRKSVEETAASVIKIYEITKKNV